MYQFYIKGAATFPVELTEEQTRQGKIIPLENGNLLHVRATEEIVRMSVMSGQTNVSIGTIFGVCWDGKWIDVTTKTSIGTKNTNGASGNWVAGLTEEDAMRHANGPLALVIGTPGEFVEVSFRDYGTHLPVTCTLRVEPATITVSKGEMVSFYVYDGANDVTSQEWQIDKGAKILSEGNVKITVGAEDAGSIVRIKMVRQYSNGRVCEGTAVLTIEEDKQDILVEAPAPVEPREPPIFEQEPTDFKEAEDVIVNESETEPSFRVMTHRKRGVRESEKISEHFLGGEYDIENLKNKSSSVEGLIENQKNEYRKGGGGLSPLTVNKIGEWSIEKRPYQGFIRMPFFGCSKVLSQEVKFNSQVLNVSEGHIEDYGILVLTGKALQLGGKIEVKATWTEEIDRGTHEGSEAVMRRSDDILREVHRIIGGE